MPTDDPDNRRPDPDALLERVKEEGARASTFTGNMGFISNYLFRGLTQSWGNPI